MSVPKPLSNSYHDTRYMRTGVEVFRQQVVVVLADGVEEPISKRHFIERPDQGDRERHVRLICATIAEATRRDLVQDAREWRALLLDRHRVVCVLVAEILHSRCQVAEED